MGRPLALMVLALLLIHPGSAGAVCVNPGGTAGCFATVQEAVDAAPDGDVVDVAAGTYVGSVVIGPGRSLTLQGAGATNTILQGTAPIIEIRGIDTFVTLRGLGVEGEAFESRLISVVNAPVSTVIEDCAVTATGPTSGTAAMAVGDNAIVRRTIVQNAWTGIAVSDDTTIEDCVFRGNGFGIMAIGGRKIAIRRTEVSGGTSTGIVLANGGRVTITDSTISGNASPGIYVVDRTRLTVERTTIADNGLAQPSCCGTPEPPTAAGVWVSDNGNRVKLRSSIVANDGPDCAVRLGARSSRIGSRGFNVLQTASCTAKPKTTDAVGVDPLLAVLADDGSGTQTHALLAGSPALARVAGRSRCTGTDQRGMPRTAPCDSGAFEAP